MQPAQNLDIAWRGWPMASIHNTGAGNQVVGVLSAQMISGDDNNVAANGVDIVAMTKSIWDYSTTSVTLAGSVGQLMKDNLDAKISTRSVYAGGPVLSVTQPVTVGTNQDKSGYSFMPMRWTLSS
jgi:hypothetical protein